MLNNLLKPQANRGFSLVELMLIVGIIAALSLIAMPHYLNLRQSGYNSSAIAAGRNAQTAQEIYFHDNENYTISLDKLLTYDPYLLDDPYVTFTFTAANSEGYRYATSHGRGNKSYQWENAGN